MLATSLEKFCSAHHFKEAKVSAMVVVPILHPLFKDLSETQLRSWSKETVVLHADWLLTVLEVILIQKLIIAAEIEKP